MEEHQEETPMPFFIAFAGKKQVGKDTATKMAVEMLEAAGKKVAVTAFAEPLKEMCITILGLKSEEVYGTDEQKNALSHILWDGFSHEVRMKYAQRESIEQATTLPRSGRMTNREVLQVMGTDVFRAIHDNVWAEAPFNRDWEDHDVVILTDCRFPNEVKTTEENNGVVVRIIRETGLVDTHASETALDNHVFDRGMTIYNDGSIGKLQTQVRSILTKLELL
jgi:hypothetical protein